MRLPLISAKCSEPSSLFSKILILQDCLLIEIFDDFLKFINFSLLNRQETLRGYKSKNFYKKGQDKLIKNYGIGAQIIKALNIKNMILVTKSKKKVVGLEGYGIKITKQEIIR